MDWHPRSELPAEVRARLPRFCEGGYLQPPVATGEGSPETGAPVTASALSARYEVDTRLVLRGDVELSQSGMAMTGGEAVFDQVAGQVDITGPMTSRSAGMLLTGEQARYDVNSGFFTIDDASFLFHQSEMRGEAAHIRRPQNHIIEIDQGYLTTCAPDRNDWSLVASEIRLNQAEGFGTATNIRLQVKDVPVFYWPWASFPIDDRRKTGFLYPTFGSSNAGSGFYLSTPYYLNLAPHYDATLNPQYIHGRGLFNEIEGRYLSELGESVLQVGFIDDDSEYEREFPGESGKRWGLDFQTRASFGGGWAGYVDYSAVSDDDYLSDLNQTLDIGSDTHLLRQGGIRYQDEWQFFEAYLSGYQTITDTVADSDIPYDQLPEVNYGAVAPLGPLEVAIDSQYTWFDRDNAGLTGLDRAVGQRTRAVPEVALPLRALWGYSRPSVSVDQTWYDLDDYELGDGSFDRTVPVAEWDSGLYLDREASLFGRSYNQSLEPRLYYAWSDAEEDQDHIPNFDAGLRSFRFDNLFRPNRFVGGDRIGDTNKTVVALTSRFNDMVSGVESARFSVGQVYYHDDRDVSLFGRGAETRSESPYAGEVVLRPTDTFDIRVSGLWDPRGGHTQEGRSVLAYHSPDYRYLVSAGHTYTRGASPDDGFEQMDLGAIFPVTDNISLIGRWVYDSQLDQTVGTLAGFEYNSCCWNFQLVNQSYLTDDEEMDNRIVFQVQLKGLGGSGGTRSTLSDAFPGYEARERRRFGTQNINP
ncbi:LPS assembly protein LptD [Marinobacter bryozoorum]|nr:LPS assembly protein LptD [Marinobacter bryozoorum]MCK7542728.1 LPS assembly protein LptD [Marinobacter bryozoorum]